MKTTMLEQDILDIMDKYELNIEYYRDEIDSCKDKIVKLNDPVMKEFFYAKDTNIENLEKLIIEDEAKLKIYENELHRLIGFLDKVKELKLLNLEEK